MANTTFLVPKIPDKSILVLKDAVEEKYGLGSASVQYSGMGFDHADIAALKKRKGPTYFITECHVYSSGSKFGFIMRRHLDKPELLHFDSLEICHTHQNVQPSVREFLEFGDLVRSIIKFPSAELLEGADNASMALLEKEIAALSSLHKEMVAETVGARAKLEADYASLTAKLQDAQLEASRSLNEKEAESIARIKQQKADLDAKLEEFDVSDHMRARRKLRDEITKEVRQFLEEPFAPTRTKAKFFGLVVILVMASFVAGFFSYETFHSFIEMAKQINTLPDQNVAIDIKVRNSGVNLGYLLWMLGIRGVVLTALCIGLALYAISIVRKVHDEEVTYQRDLQRYGMDINRASWIIETAMEMTTKEGATLPERWVEGACRGLFQSPTQSDGNNDPISALGAIMGMAPDITVEGDGKKFDFKSKNVAKAAK